MVAGGASGIGWAVARGFAAEGASVALWDLHPETGLRAGELAEEFAVRTRAAVLDVTDGAAVAGALESLEANLGPVEHLVHAAAIGSGKFGFPFTNLAPEDWVKVLHVNVMGMVQVAHAVAPKLVERRRGTMVFIASVAGQIGSPTDPPYSASKAANINFAQCMAKDLAASNVRVNTVCPGMVKTPLNRGVWEAWSRQQPAGATPLSYEEWAEDKIKKIVPLGRWQRPEDVADMVVFLSSRRAQEVTGQTINVDGGFVMHW